MKITYKLSFPEPHTHYVEVEITLTGITASELILKMAVWTPGSYLVREFQKNIDFVESIINGETHRLQKIDKNSWRVNTENISEAIIRYKTYCFEYSVRTNFIDDSHALLNGAPTFLYIDGYEQTPCDIYIEPYSNWKKISSPLQQKNDNPWWRTAANVDELIDSPFEIGNHVSHFFNVGEVEHEVAIYGTSNCDTEKLLSDLKSVIAEEVRIFGSHPCSSYVFIIHNTDAAFGGLEHLNSSVNFVGRWSYEPKKYQQVISLLAHEYFHLWNVKRIRPDTLGPFDYSNENYTTLLWFFEGITSYYDDYICYRAGVTAKQEFFDIVVKNINDVINTAAIDVQTLSESSFDAWVKYYRRTENSGNTQISYYTKGAIIGLLFDFIIMDATQGEKSLDDVMKSLYDRYKASQGKGITENELLSIFNLVSGIDFSMYFDRYIHSPGLRGIGKYFELMGMELKDTTNKNLFYLGLSTQWQEGKLVVTELDKNYGAYKSGLNVQDEILAVDGYRATKDFFKIYSHKSIGDTIQLLVSRQGTIKDLTITLSADSRKYYTLKFPQNISSKQGVLLKQWLHE